MATVLDRVPVDRITTQARDVRFGHTVLTVIAAVFFSLGWMVAKVWLAIVWCAVAVKVGWQEARYPTNERSRADER